MAALQPSPTRSATRTNDPGVGMTPRNALSPAYTIVTYRCSAASPPAKLTRAGSRYRRTSAPAPETAATAPRPDQNQPPDTKRGYSTIEPHNVATAATMVI